MSRRRLVGTASAALLGAIGLAAPAPAQVIRDRTVTASTGLGACRPAFSGVAVFFGAAVGCGTAVRAGAK